MKNPENMFCVFRNFRSRFESRLPNGKSKRHCGRRQASQHELGVSSRRTFSAGFVYLPRKTAVSKYQSGTTTHNSTHC